MSRKQRRDGQDTREIISKAADATFAERGFYRTTIKTLADVSGVSKALIHHHFGGKDRL